MTIRMNTLQPGDRVGSTIRTTPTNTLQPWLRNDHRGTILPVDRSVAARINDLAPGYTDEYLLVQWDFGATYWERVALLFPDGSPPDGYDWSTYRGE